MEARITDLENPASQFSQTEWSLGGFFTGGGINLFNLMFFFVGLAFFANLTIASLTYITSEGDPAKISKAGSRITNSLIGLIITFAAFVIVRLVIALFGIEDPAQQSIIQ